MPNERKNGFKRLFLKASARIRSEVTLPPTVNGIAGIQADDIYFFTNSADTLLKTNYKMDEVAVFTFSLEQSVKSNIGTVFSTQIGPAYSFIFAKNLPGFIRVNLFTEETTTFMNKGAYSSGIALSENTYVIRQFIRSKNNSQFIKLDISSGRTRKEGSLPLNPLDRRLLISDGQLHYDRSTQTLIYVHYYNNTVITFDTLMKSNRRFFTISTVTDVPTNLYAPLVINQKSFVSKGLLFICSNLKSDNETRKCYWKNIPVDVYDIQTGSYHGSFYLPLSEGKLVKSIQLYNDTLVALYHDNNVKLFSIHHILQALEPSVPL